MRREREKERGWVREERERNSERSGGVGRERKRRRARGWKQHRD